MNKYGYTILVLTWIAFGYCIAYEEDVVKDLRQQIAANERIYMEEVLDADVIIAEQEKIISIMKDGASYTEAINVIDASNEVGLDPKYSQR